MLCIVPKSFMVLQYTWQDIYSTSCTLTEADHVIEYPPVVNTHSPNPVNGNSVKFCVLMIWFSYGKEKVDSN